jgi:hypothetical protein
LFVFFFLFAFGPTNILRKRWMMPKQKKRSCYARLGCVMDIKRHIMGGICLLEYNMHNVFLSVHYIPKTCIIRHKICVLVAPRCL